MTAGARIVVSALTAASRLTNTATDNQNTLRIVKRDCATKSPPATRQVAGTGKPAGDHL